MSGGDIPVYLKINVEEAASRITGCIRYKVEEAGASGVVLGLSGGVDSSVTAALAVRALGARRIKVLVMPDRESNPQGVEDAYRVASILGLRPVKIDITRIVESFLESLGTGYDEAPRVPKGNLKARARMSLLYYVANSENRLVLGTGDRSEILIGYFTKWGDGAADLLPLGSLYKTQVRLLAEYLGLPSDIAWKPSSPDLWPGQTAAGELGVDYDVIDRVLYHIVDLGLGDKEASDKAGVPLNLVARIRSMIKASRHKREPPPPCPA